MSGLRAVKKKLGMVYRDTRATYYLKKNKCKVYAANEVMKVAFIVFEPETWDKEQPVYEELKKRENVKVDLIVVPSFDQKCEITTSYGEEWNYFVKMDKKAIPACDKQGVFLDIEPQGYHYVFYQSPYNDHMPKILNSNHVVKFAKICYVPYGFSGSDVFVGGNSNPRFFRNVFWGFSDVELVQITLQKRYYKNCQKGIQNFKLLGYPAFDREIRNDWGNTVKKVLWTPRWSYAPKIGGSHFLEYKEGFMSLSGIYPDVACVFRPHPLMFINFIKEGRFTEKQRDEYIEALKAHNIKYSKDADLNEDFKDTDLLITDFSTIIPTFFMTGKPIIYCPSDIEFNKEYKQLEGGLYVAGNWNEIETYVKRICQGEDALKEKRQQIIKNFFGKHRGATKRIADAICDDFFYSCEKEER